MKKNLSYPSGGLLCPLTRGTKTRFTCFDSYKKNCEFQKRKVLIGINRTTIPLYQQVCSKCKNYKNVRELVHGAEIISLQELVAMRKAFVPSRKQTFKKLKPYKEGVDIVSSLLEDYLI